MQLMLLLQREVGDRHIELVCNGALHPVDEVPIALSLQVPAQLMKIKSATAHGLQLRM